ncbi:unnamed protein product, partial [Discosporangium mesarthrocarpum]
MRSCSLWLERRVLYRCKYIYIYFKYIQACVFPLCVKHGRLAHRMNCLGGYCHNHSITFACTVGDMPHVKTGSERRPPANGSEATYCRKWRHPGGKKLGRNCTVQ